jgi:hypothetical protein
LPSLPEYTKAKPNNHQTKEQSKTTSTSSSDASLITKLEQVQVLHNNHNNPNNSTKGKPADTKSECNGNSNHDSQCRNCSNHPFYPDFGISNNSKFTYNLGGNTFNTEDGSVCNDSNSSSGSSNVPYNANAYHSFNHNCNKSILTTSDIDLFLPLNSVQVTYPVDTPHSASTNLPSIHLASSNYTCTVQHALFP